MGILLLFTCYFGYILYRSYAIPVTHDEAATSMLCARNSVKQLLNYDYGYISGNNHILNSIAIKLFTELFNGYSALSVRLGNLILGAFYLWAGLTFVFRFFQNNWVRALACTIWVSNPYAMEFFGLARGYGMSMALEALAIIWTIRYFEAGAGRSSTAWLVASVLCAVLAVWSNFAMLNFYLYFVVALLALMWYKNRKVNLEWAAPLGGTLLLYILCVTPIEKIKKAGDFGFFGSAGFWKDTVESFAACALMGKTYFGPQTNFIIGIGLTLLVLSATALAFVQWRSQQKSVERFLLAWMVALLPGTVLVNVLVAKLNHTSWLNTRTTLLFYPLLVFCLLGLLKLVSTGQSMVQQVLIGTIIVLLSLHFTKVANVVKSQEWDYDRSTFTVLNYIEKSYKEEGRQNPYGLYVYCFQHPSFQFHTWVSNSHYNQYIQEIQEVPRNVPDVINTEIDFYYITKAHFPAFSTNYKILLELLDGEMLLIRKK